MRLSDKFLFLASHTAVGLAFVMMYLFGGQWTRGDALFIGAVAWLFLAASEVVRRRENDARADQPTDEGDEGGSLPRV